MSNEIETPALAEIVAQDAKVVGDENVEVYEGEVEVNTESVPAQVSQPREDAAAEVPVHEVHVATDEVITDTSNPLAVQIPDAGRGSLDLPIHALGNGTPESVFAAEASEAEEADEEPSAPAEEPTQ